MSNQDCTILCEIKMLEERIEEIFSRVKHFKEKSVTDKSVFELQILRANFNSKSQIPNNLTFLVLAISIVLTYIFNVIFINGIIGVLTGILIMVPLILYLFLNLDIMNSGIIRDFTYVVGLLDMLIERKSELEKKTSQS